MLDDAQALGDVHERGRDHLAPIPEPLRREVEHRVDVGLSLLDDFGRDQRRVRRSVVGHLAEAAELLNRVLDDERRQLLARRRLRDDDRRVDVVRSHDL